jgi:hypothetical protein
VQCDLVSVIAQRPYERKPPNHPLTLCVEYILAGRHLPKASEFPAADTEFVEKRNGELIFDGI